MLNDRRGLTRARGFTIIEAMLVVAILGILAGIAMPNLQSAINSYRVRTGAEGILTGLQLARTEAIRRNGDVFYCSGQGSGWSVRTASCTGTVIQQRPESEGGSLSVSATPANVSFNSLGRASAAMTVNVSSTANANVTLRITVFVGGQVRMCNPQISTANDPRRC